MGDIDALHRRFVEIARTLPEELLRSASAADADEHDLIGDLLEEPEERLLGYYSISGVQLALERYGLYDTLRGRGYRDFAVKFDLQPYHHTLRVTVDDLLICECRLRRARGLTDPCIAEFQRHLTPEVLVVEWLTLGDPRAHFTTERPQLPGQTHPGTGIADEVMVILAICARRLSLHGVVDIPERFHNAVLYRRKTHFIDPEFEGRFLALLRLLERHALAEVAWAMEEGRVIDETTGAPILWAPREQLLVLDDRLDAYFELPAWRRARAHTRDALRPRLSPTADP